jgi:predicted nucleotidyltransferase
MIDNLEQTKRTVAEIQRDFDRNEGALSEFYKQLKAKFGLKTLKEAKALYEEIVNQELAISKKYAKEFETFKEENAEVLKKYDKQ